MSWSVGGQTVPNPVYPDGLSQADHPIGKAVESLDGSLVPVKITTRKVYTCKWRLVGTNYANLMTGLRAIHLVAGTVTDHLSVSETMTITDDLPYPLVSNTVREVTVTLRETTA
jgi:hypothetical protein